MIQKYFILRWVQRYSLLWYFRCMAGLYIHIPYCKQKCHYCDFHFSTFLHTKTDFLQALLKEIVFQKDYLLGESIQTIYFGGGTPSLLDKEAINKVMDSIDRNFNIASKAEITLEANPDDLTSLKVKDLKQTAINRFSIGVQSFQDADLQFMNRAHSASEAMSSIKRVQDAGWENISMDLIYGTPTLSDSAWNENLTTFTALQVPHLSAYALTVEENTALHHFIEHKKCPPVEEEKSARHFLQLMETLPKSNFIQYEISNFGKENYFSQHNSNYWKREKYLGLGPSAHSYNGIERHWNVSNNAKYIIEIDKGIVPAEKETLHPQQNYNDYLLTNLRTIWGVNTDFVKSAFLGHFYDFLIDNCQKWIKSGHILQENELLTLSQKGKFMADGIAQDLFWVD